MRTIEIDDEIYSYLLQNAQEIGESASDILHRLLNLPSYGPKYQDNTHEFEEALKDGKFLTLSSAVDKFLYFLSIAYKQRGNEFEKVLAIQGRGRIYIAKSKEEIERSGNSTQPRAIPSSPYWIMTNSPTKQKKQILKDALKLLGYSAKAINSVTATIR